MNFFAGIGRKHSTSQDRHGMPDLELLNRTVEYAQHLILPEKRGTATIQAASAYGGQGACLLFYTDGTEAGSMNAGYLVGQSLAFLRFLGVEAVIGRVMPEGVLNNPPGAQRFAAALFLEERECRTTGERRKGREQTAQSPCICTENRENWSDELLSFAKARYPRTFRRIRASRKESWIHFAMKRSGKRHAEEDAFEAGMAAANIMTAAEELWVDLEMVKIRAAAPEGYLFSVCRKGDRRISYA